MVGYETFPALHAAAGWVSSAAQIVRSVICAPFQGSFCRPCWRLCRGSAACPRASGRPRAEDFRVDNVIYLGDQKGPWSESTTIFHGGVVYDHRRDPAETVVLDSAAGRFVLLNLTHRTRSELSTGFVVAFTDRLQQLAAKSPDPLTKFFAKPNLTERFDETAGELTLSSQWRTYRLLLSAEASPPVVEQYHESCDWYARLNTMLNPGSPPPFVRLVVNAALAKRHAIASQVVLTDTSGKAPKQPTTIRSLHRVVRPLDPADLKLVAETRQFVESFTPVSFDQYRKPQ